MATWLDGANTRARGVGRRSDARERRSRVRRHPVTERTGVGLRWTTTHRPCVAVCSSARPVGRHTAAGHGGRSQPIFSPDGEWVAFFADAKLKKIALSGGAPVTLCDTPDAKGGAWWARRVDSVRAVLPGTDRAGLLRVSSTGGTPTPVTRLADGEVAHGWPQVLPGGNACSLPVTPAA